MPQGGALGTLVWYTGDLKAKSREVLKEGTVKESLGERTCRKKESCQPPGLVPSALERIQFDMLSHHRGWLLTLEGQAAENDG